MAMATRASYDMTVKIRDEGSQKEEVYFLVRVTEEEPRENKISMYHPLGKAIFSRTAGDVVEAYLDDGSVRKIKILEIEPT